MWQQLKGKSSAANLLKGRYGHTSVVYGKMCWIFGGEKYSISALK